PLHVSSFTFSIFLTPRFTFNPKEGINNPALISLTSLGVPAQCPSYVNDSVFSCPPEPDPSPALLAKVQGGPEFWLHLCMERSCQGYVVRQVDPWSPAELSGLKDGDCVLEVNEDSMRTSPQGVNQMRLIVSVCISPGQKGRYMLSTVSECPAERAGVRSGDRLVWINGAMVSTLTHSAISKMKCSVHVTVLVINRESEASYIRRKLPILPIMAGSHNLPHRPQTMHLVQGSDGYGFLLRQGRLSSGAHLLREVDVGSPAEEAGMQDGDLLLAVNWHPSESMARENIVRKVRKSGKRVSLTTIPIHGRDFYTQVCKRTEELCQLKIPSRSKNTVYSVSYLKMSTVLLPCPRLCVLEREREESGFGFNLGCFSFVLQVVVKGLGHRAGLWEGDVVVEVNGQNMENEYLEDVVTLIKRSATSLKLLVAERSEYERLKQSGLPITPGVILHRRGTLTCAHAHRHTERYKC
uniref:PDZ domain containing 3a n=1 Tax=Oncorhynchus kisutch TaxID=8019 RepID=A0A8C7H7K9_ONCKI